VFPASNPWNKRVDNLPVASNSNAIVASIGTGTGLHADFGSGVYQGRPIGIPYQVVSRHTRRAPFKFQYADESDGSRYPVGTHPRIEGGSASDGDRHVLMIDRDACKLYEVSGAYPHNGGRSWTGWSGAIWNLRSNKVRPRLWDLRRRRRPADLPRPRALRRGEARVDRPRAALHRRADEAGFHLPRAPLRLHRHEPRPAGHGPAPAPQGELRHLGLPAAGAGRARRAEALRDDRGRQRLGLVHQAARRTATGATTTCTRSAA